MSETNGTHGIRHQVQPTRPRVTPAPAGQRFRQALGEGSQALLQGVEGAAQLVPGGTVVTAAIRGARTASGAGAGGGVLGGQGLGGQGLGGTTGSLESVLQQQADQSMQYLALQQQLGAENRRFTTLSNLMKARHETAKSAINNLK